MTGQHPLPGIPPSSITLVKRFQIYTSSTGGLPMSDLQWHILGYEEVDRIGDGKPVTPSDDFTKIVRDFVIAPPNIPPVGMAETAPPPTQLDFVVSKPCCVLLKLIGNFWEYTPGSFYVSTKREYPDARYRRAFPVLNNEGRIAAVGFFVESVVNPNEHKTRDGINLYVDFVQGNFRLPTIIDPDIENKGDIPKLGLPGSCD